MADPHVKALLAILEIKEQMNDRFLQELVMHLDLSVPSFDGRGFLDALYSVQEFLPSPDKSDPQAATTPEAIRLEAWRRKIEMTERALRNAGVSRSKESE